MFTLKARLGTIIAAALVTTAFALPASPAMASAKSCQQEANGPLNTCVYVNGSGLHINYMQGSVFNTGSRNQSNVHIQLTWPSGATIKNCASTTISPGATIYCTWSPNKNEPAGTYCANSWQYVSGSYIRRGHACVNVHA
jgi:hypothetical protein